MNLPDCLSRPLYEVPKLIILRQPKKRGYRFRYKSEGETHGGIPGEPDHHSGNKKFYPTIEILGHNGPAKVVVTLVTADKPHNLHAHSMIVNREPMKGYCIFDMPANSNILELKNVAIQHAIKEKLTETLMDRILQDKFVRQFGWNSAIKIGEVIKDVDYYTSILEDRDNNSSFLDRNTAKAIAGHELKELEKCAKDLAKDMHMNRCCLCFQAFLQDKNGKYTQVLDRVFSNVIIDGKTKEGAMLKIIRLSKVTSSVNGGEEIWLLADKLNADDVEVRFFIENSISKAVEWESFGEFSKADVYKQAVLIFRTPKYPDIHIDQPIKVYLQLRRKKDTSCVSLPLPFTYKPKKYDPYAIGAKRKKMISDGFSNALKQEAMRSPIAPQNMFNLAGSTGGASNNVSTITHEDLVRLARIGNQQSSSSSDASTFMMVSKIAPNAMPTLSQATKQQQQHHSIVNQFPAFSPSPASASSTSSSSQQQQHFNFNLTETTQAVPNMNTSAAALPASANFMQFPDDVSNFQQEQHQQFVISDATLSLPNDCTTSSLEESADNIHLSFLNNIISGDTEIKNEPDELTFPPETTINVVASHSQFNQAATGMNDLSFSGFLAGFDADQSNGSWTNSPMNEDTE